MPKMHAINRRAAGLQTQFNPFETPPGALEKADNCVIDREGVIERRRGFDYYGDKLSLTGINLIGEYKDRVHGHLTDKIFWDTDGAGTWTSAVTYAAPAADARMRGIEARSNFYFTTDNGIYKKDALANAPVKAGMPRGPDLKLSFGYTTSLLGWFLPDTQVGYRIVYTRDDANDFRIVGAPSPRFDMANETVSVTIDWGAGRAVVYFTAAHGLSTGNSLQITDASHVSYEGTHTVTVIDTTTVTYELLSKPSDITDVTATAGRFATVAIIAVEPHDLASGDNYELYRSKMSASATTPPGDRLFLVRRRALTVSGAGSPNALTADDLPEAFLGHELYTNPAQETLRQENSRPPFAKDISYFYGQMHFANTKRQHFLEITLEEIDDLTAGTSTITIDDGTNSHTYNAETAESGSDFLLSTAESTDAANIRETMKSFARTVNLTSTAGRPWNAYYVSGVDDKPGTVLIEAVGFNQAAFYLTANSAATGNAFEPNIPTSGQTTISKNDAKQNNLAYAKFEQPDHVPALNEDPIGSEEDPIQRILALRDSLIILKDEDGVWRKDRQGVISQLDPNIRLYCPESAVVLNDAVYGMTNQGVVKITENGTSIVSRPIEEDLKKILRFTNFRTTTHAVGFDTDRQYILFTQNVDADAHATVAWVYNFLTDGGMWTKWLLPVTGALVAKSSASLNDDLLYMTHADYEFVLRQRRDENDTTDYMDWDLDDSTVTITASTTEADPIFPDITVTKVTLSYTSQDNALAEGMLLTQGGEVRRITKVTDLGGNSYDVHVDDSASDRASYSNAAATLTMNIPAEVKWAPEDANDQNTQKKWIQASIYLEDTSARFHALGFETEETAEAFSRQIRQNLQKIRTFVPRDYARSNVLSLSYKNLYARENFKITGMALLLRPGGFMVTQAPR